MQVFIAPDTTTKLSTPSAVTIAPSSPTVAPTTVLPLPPGDEPKYVHWFTNITTSTDQKEEYPRLCLEKCKENCPGDKNHKCLGKVHPGKHNLVAHNCLSSTCLMFVVLYNFFLLLITLQPLWKSSSPKWCRCLANVGHQLWRGTQQGTAGPRDTLATLGMTPCPTREILLGGYGFWMAMHQSTMRRGTMENHELTTMSIWSWCCGLYFIIEDIHERSLSVNLLFWMTDLDGFSLWQH